MALVIGKGSDIFLYVFCPCDLVIKSSNFWITSHHSPKSLPGNNCNPPPAVLTRQPYLHPIYLKNRFPHKFPHHDQDDLALSQSCTNAAGLLASLLLSLTAPPLSLRSQSTYVPHGLTLIYYFKLLFIHLKRIQPNQAQNLIKKKVYEAASGSENI